MDEDMFDSEAVAHIIVGCIKCSKFPLKTIEFFKKTCDNALIVTTNQHEVMIELNKVSG